MTDDVIDPASNEAARAALASLIDLHGPALLHEPERLKRQLDGALPDAPREVELILSSLREEVPQALLAAHSDDQLRTLFPQLVERLVRKAGLDRGGATRAVRTWAHALAVAVESRGAADRPDGLRRSIDRPTRDRSLGAGHAHPGDAAIERQMHEERESSRRASTAEVLGFGTRPVRLKAPSTVRPTGPLVSPPPAAETLVAFDASRERTIEPSVVDAEAPATPTVEAIDESDAPAPVLPSVPAPAVAPAPPPQPAAVDVPRAPRDLHEEPPFVEPVAPAAEAPPSAIEAAPIVVPAVQAPSAPPTPRGEAERPPPRGEQEPDESPLPFAPQRRSSSRTFALAAAIAAAVIVIGATLWPSPQTVPAPEPRTATSASTAVRPAAEPAAAPATVTPAPAAPEPVAPASATVATAAVPPSPASAEPPPVASGESSIAASQPTGPAVVTSEPPPDVQPPAPDVASPVRKAPLPVGAAATASTTPAPKPAPRVVRPPDAPIGRPVAVAAVTPKPTKPAEPRTTEPRKQTAAPAACTRSTCGSVVSVRPIDDAATRDYEVIVRLDDRTIRAVRMPARWSTGARVRVVGGRFEPAGDR